MSKYTTLLRYPIEQELDELGYPHDESYWPFVYDHVGLGDYPIFDIGYRSTLNNKIIRAYYFREIGFETFEQFRWQIRRMMHEIMPYYNQLYLSQDLVTDPMTDTDTGFSEAWTRDAVNSSASTSHASRTGETASDDRSVFQDTPMNRLDYDSVEDFSYATNVTDEAGTTKSSDITNSDSAGKRVDDDEGTKRHDEKGRTKSQSDLLIAYRSTFINIDRDIIEELQPLFMSLW